VILEFKISIMGKFNKFIEEQVAWVSNWKTDAKRPGILAPFAKLPKLLDRMQASMVLTEKSSYIQEASTAYLKIALVLFQLLEHVSLANPKYANVIKMENCYFFKHTISQRDIPALQEYINQASQIFEVSCQEYLDWLIQCQFPHVIAFFSRIEDLVASVGPHDVIYHENRKSLDGMLKKYLDEKSVPEGLKLINSRMEKHLCNESALAPVLWDHLSDMMFALFSRYEELCNICYNVKLNPSASQVRYITAQYGGQKGRALAKMISESTIDNGEAGSFGNFSSPLRGDSSQTSSRRYLNRSQFSSIIGTGGDNGHNHSGGSSLANFIKR